MMYKQRSANAKIIVAPWKPVEGVPINAPHSEIVKATRGNEVTVVHAFSPRGRKFDWAFPGDGVRKGSVCFPRDKNGRKGGEAIESAERHGSPSFLGGNG